MKTIIKCSLILILSLIVAPVYADDFHEGLDAYNRKDYKTALEKFKQLAEQGSILRQNWRRACTSMRAAPAGDFRKGSPAIANVKKLSAGTSTISHPGGERAFATSWHLPKDPIWNAKSSAPACGKVPPEFH